jgi:hypothetical protein
MMNCGEDESKSVFKKTSAINGFSFLLFHSKKNSELKNVANNRYKVNLV